MLSRVVELTSCHRSVLGVSLLTRDRGRYAHYFPKLALITPH
jgi:hypothetical protein